MEICTSYFSRLRKSVEPNAVYVSIAVGNPKFALPVKLEHLKMLKPFGIVWKYTGEEYRRRYFERLDSYGVERIHEALQSIGEGYDKVVLLCYEKNPLDCHRSMFAEWWYEHTGEVVEELSETKEEKAKKELTQTDLFGMM